METNKIKSKFYVIIVETEYWDTKGERATPNINLDIKTCDNIEDARAVLSGIVSKYTNTGEYVADWVDFRSDHCDVRSIKSPSPEHHDFPIRTTVHAEINVLNGNGNMVSSNWFSDEDLKNMEG